MKRNYQTIVQSHLIIELNYWKKYTKLLNNELSADGSRQSEQFPFTPLQICNMILICWVMFCVRRHTMSALTKCPPFCGFAPSVIIIFKHAWSVLLFYIVYYFQR